LELVNNPYPLGFAADKTTGFHETSGPDTKKPKSPKSKDYATTHPVRDKPADVAMDIDTTHGEAVGPPPTLSYPPTDEPPTAGRTLPTPNEGPTHIIIDVPDPQPATAPPLYTSGPVLDPRKMASVFKDFQAWKRGMLELKKRLNDGSRWTDKEIQKIFGKLGLLQWWWDIKAEEEAGRKPEWEVWRQKIIDEWRVRFPMVPPGEFESTTEALLDQNAQIATTHSLAVKISEVPDVEMEKRDVSANSDPSSTRTVYVPPNSAPSGGVYLYQRVPDLDEVAELKSRIEELEDRFFDVESDLRSSLDRLQDTVFMDGVALTNLKWKVREIADDGGRKRRKGKRSYKKVKAKAHHHRYPTRYSEAHSDEVVEPGRKEIKGLEVRMKALESKTDVNREEIGRLEAELLRAEDLAPKIGALTAGLEAFKVTQLKMNINFVQEFARLRAFYSTVVEPKVASHSAEIAGLTARYNLLHALATTLFGNSLLPSNVPASHLYTKTRNASQSASTGPINPYQSLLTPARRVSPV
jgi:hypothetical protein